MPTELETWSDPDELWLGRGSGTNPCRPIFTGDVFALGGEGFGQVVVLEHPCAMRAGARLADTVLVAPVTTHPLSSATRWREGHFDYAPLPDLDGPTVMSACQLSALTRVESASLDRSTRTACLLPFGVNLLQQRLVWYLTRCAIRTATFELAFSRFYEEADLLEEWCEAAIGAGVGIEEAEADGEGVLSARGATGTSPRELLADPQHRAAVRRVLKASAVERYGR